MRRWLGGLLLLIGSWLCLGASTAEASPPEETTTTTSTTTIAPPSTTDPTPFVPGAGEDWFQGSAWVAGAVVAVTLVFVRYLMPERV